MEQQPGGSADTWLRAAAIRGDLISTLRVRLGVQPAPGPGAPVRQVPPARPPAPQQQRGLPGSVACRELRATAMTAASCPSPGVPPPSSPSSGLLPPLPLPAPLPSSPDELRCLQQPPSLPYRPEEMSRFPSQLGENSESPESPSQVILALCTLINPCFILILAHRAGNAVHPAAPERGCSCKRSLSMELGCGRGGAALVQPQCLPLVSLLRGDLAAPNLVGPCLPPKTLP